MLGASNDSVAISVLDHCRIRWGEVTEVEGEHHTRRQLDETNCWLTRRAHVCVSPSKREV